MFLTVKPGNVHNEKIIVCRGDDCRYWGAEKRAVSDIVDKGSTAFSKKNLDSFLKLNFVTMAAVGWFRSVYHSFVIGSRVA